MPICGSSTAQYASPWKEQRAKLAGLAHGAHAPPSAAAPSIHDETIQTTTNHPWLTADHGWILASFLRVGEPVQRVDGSTALVVAVRAEPGAAAMWDLTVSTVHTFAVGGGAYVVHNCGQVEYGSTDLSQAVKDRRIELHENGHNFGAARLEDDSVITGVSQGRGYHAEQDLLDQADAQGKRIVELYSEREPCGGCARLLQSRGITDVTWTWAYRDVDVAGRSAIGAAIRSIYRGLW